MAKGWTTNSINDVTLRGGGFFVDVALLPQTWHPMAVMNATDNLPSHSQLLTGVYFPRETLPPSYALAAMFDSLIVSTVLAAMMLYYRVLITVKALYTVQIILVFTSFSLSIALLFSGHRCALSSSQRTRHGRRT